MKQQRGTDSGGTAARTPRAWRCAAVILLVVMLCTALVPLSCAAAAGGGAAVAGAPGQTAAPAPSATLAPATQRRVRVGFFAMDGYHMQGDDGMKSGYGYDLLQMLSRYNNWELEYVGYDKSWGEMLEMLERGEIDLVTSAQKTPEREAKFTFSEKAIGTSATIFTVRAGDSRFVIGSPASYEGARVGMLYGNSRNQSFAAFAAEAGFGYTPVYFDSTEALTAALHDTEQIDAVVTSNLRKLENETILEEFDPSSFYVLTRKTDFTLSRQVNESIAALDLDEPGWRTRLNSLYYTAQTGEAISFNAGEVDYLAALRADGVVLRVTSNPDLAPYSYVEDGVLKGIVPDIFNELAARLALDFVYVPAAEYEEYNALVEQGGVDIDLTCFFSYTLAERFGVSLTDPYLTTTMAKLTRADSDGVIGTAALLSASRLQTGYAGELLSGVRCVEYPSVKSCTQAVLSGRADGVYLYAYTAQQAANEDARNRLAVELLPEYAVSLSIGVNRAADYRLLTILNKGVKSVKSSYVQQAVQQNTAFLTRSNSFLALIYDHPGAALLIMACLFSAVLFCLLLTVRIRSLRRSEKQRRELSRFMGYVCETNESVLEVDLDTLLCRRHTMEDGILCSVDEPFRFAHYNNSNNTFDPEDFARIAENLKGLKTNSVRGGSQYFEAYAKGADGVKRWYSYTLRSIPRDSEHRNSFILFKKNIDEVKRQEESRRRTLEDALAAARTASEAKGQFLSRMSHEIRTPLNAVIGYMDIAKNSADSPEKVRHCIENSGLAARHLLGILNDVLDISSIESGRMKIASEQFDLKTQLTTLSTIFFQQARAKGVSFETVMHALTEECVVGDSLRVNQVLMNLLSNAVKFTPAGGAVTLGVTQMSLKENTVFLKFEVRDTGIGMSEEYRKKLFVPFEQESASTARKYGGTGLGLSISYNLVQMMGGSMDVESRQGEGSVFTVLLHFGRAAHSTTDTEKLPVDYARLRALVVDDEKDSCDYVKALLKRCGVKSDSVHSGEAAVRQLKRRMGTDYQYDICILDWHMPGMDGLETAKRLHELDSTPPLIIATAYDASALADEARACGVTRVISKPLFQSTLFDLLVTHFGKYAPAPSKQTAASAELTGARVLLAEDNAMNQEIAVDVLTRAGLCVDTADNGQLACEKFEAAPAGTYQAILMDIQMPVLDGYGAARRIRASAHPEAKTIPILAMTANAFVEDVAAALASGMNDHIAKPVDYDKLFRALSRLVKPGTQRAAHGGEAAQ